MDYEKKYKDALERAKYALTTDMDESGHWAVKHIFPELKESEDGKCDFCSRDLEIMKSETSKDGECITIPKERYQELLDYESLALWFLNLIIVSSLPNIEMTSDAMKDISNDAKYKAVQDMLKEALKAKGE